MVNVTLEDGTWKVKDSTAVVVPSLARDPRAEPALEFINSYRARHAQRPLDPVLSGWTDLDLLIEAKRLGWAGG